MSVKDDLHFLIERYGYARRNGEHQGKKSAEWMAEIDHTIDACVAEALADPLAMLERLAREFDGCAEANSRDFDGVWAMVEIGKRGKVYYAVNGRRYPREEAAALLKGGDA
jgi:hypothetical protein